MGRSKSDSSALKQHEFVAHSVKVNCLNIGRKTGHVMVTGGEDRRVNMWAIGQPNAIMSLSGHVTPVECVAFDSAEEYVVAGSASGTLKLWDLCNARVIRTLVGHNSNCSAVDFHPYGEFFASGSQDTNLKVWDIRRKGCIQTYKGHTDGINCIQFSPDGRWVVSGGNDGVVKLWDLTAGRMIKDFHHNGPITSLQFHPNEFLLASGSADRTVRFWDLEKMTLLHASDPDTNRVRAITFHPNGSTLYSCSQDAMRSYGWEPFDTFNSISVPWGRVCDATVTRNQLIGAGCKGNAVSIWMVNLEALHSKGKDVNMPAVDTSPIRPSTIVSSAIRVSKPSKSSDPSPSISPPRLEPLDVASALSITKDQPDHHIPVEKVPPENSQLQHYEVKSEPLDPVAFLPSQKPATPALTTDQSGMDLDEERVLEALHGGHDAVMAVLSNRLQNLRIIRRHWANGTGVRNALIQMTSMDDQGVIVDILNTLCIKPGLWSLDICAIVLPLLDNILCSKYDTYILTALSVTKLVLKNFAPIIQASLSATPSIGVDFAAEERREKSTQCDKHLHHVAATVSNFSRHGQTDKVQSKLREASIMLSNSGYS